MIPPLFPKNPNADVHLRDQCWNFSTLATPASFSLSNSDSMSQRVNSWSQERKSKVTDLPEAKGQGDKAAQL